MMVIDMVLALRCAMDHFGDFVTWVDQSGNDGVDDWDDDDITFGWLWWIGG